MEPAIELRQLRYFVAVAEELHFGRAADRLHMSQSPLSRAIRDLERQLEVVLFVRTTRRVELTAAGTALLARATRALADVEGAVDDVRRAGHADGGALGLGFGPLSRGVATRIAGAVAGPAVHLAEGVTPDLLDSVATGRLGAAVVMRSPGAAQRHGLHVTALCDEPLLAALPASDPHATAATVPLETFVAGNVLLPREPVGAAFNAWLRAALLVEGHALTRTTLSLSAPWDRRMLPVARGEAVSVVVAEWGAPPIPDVALVPFDPPLSFPIDLATPPRPGDDIAALVSTALRLRDKEGWLTRRAAREEPPRH